MRGHVLIKYVGKSHHLLAKDFVVHVDIAAIAFRGWERERKLIEIESRQVAAAAPDTCGGVVEVSAGWSQPVGEVGCGRKLCPAWIQVQTTCRSCHITTQLQVIRTSVRAEKGRLG